MNEAPDGDEEECGGSPPCFLQELGPDGVPVDPQQTRDVARWRKAERERLIGLRCALPAGERALCTAAIEHSLEAIIPGGAGEIVSVYWPIRAEPDLRPWMEAA